MPIARTYYCPECNYRIDVVLNSDQWDDPPPSCAQCDARELAQEFKPPAIGGSVSMRAHSIAEDIIANDYGVANFTPDSRARQGSTPTVRYKDQTDAMLPSAWQTGAVRSQGATISNALETAIAIGRQTRLESGNGLDILRRNLQTGAQPDLIEVSKRRAIKVW